MQRRFILIGVLAGALLGGAGCREQSAEPPEEVAGDTAAQGLDPALAAHLPAGVDFATAEAGRRLFPVCGVCHGLDGRGTQLGPSLTEGPWIHISGEMEEIAAIVREGVAEPESHPIPMPPLGGGDFDEEEVRALAAYVYLLGRDRPED